MTVSIQSIDSESRGADYLHGSALLLLLVGVCLILLGLLLSQFAAPAVVFGIIALLVSCFVVPSRWPCGALLVLFIASALPRVKVEIGGWNARPEHCAALLVLLVFLFRWMFHESPRISLTGTDYWVAAYVVWNYVSSGWMSPDPKLTLRWALLNNLVVLPYFLIRIVVTDERLLRWAFRAFIAIGIAECAFAVMAYASRQIFRTSFGTEVDQYAGGLGGVYGTQYEPNLLGSCAGCVSIMLLVLYFLSDRKPRWLIGGIIIGLTALLVSLSRGAFLGFALVSMAIVLVGVRAGLVSAKKLLLLGLIVTFFVTPIAATVGKNLLSRFVSLSAEEVQNDAEAMGRLVAWSAALEDIVQHPWVGNGTASFQLLADAKQLPILGDRPWVGNSPVRILHDTGVIGLFLMGAVVVGIGRNVWGVIKGKGQGREIVLVLTSGCLVYTIAFMSTEGTMLSFFWVHMGLLASACSLAKGAAAG
jgi:O-antigen ligase